MNNEKITWKLIKKTNEITTPVFKGRSTEAMYKTEREKVIYSVEFSSRSCGQPPDKWKVAFSSHVTCDPSPCCHGDHSKWSETEAQVSLLITVFNTCQISVKWSRVLKIYCLADKWYSIVSTRRGGSRISQMGRGRQPLSLKQKPVILQHFYRKLHENERNWIKRRHASLMPLSKESLAHQKGTLHTKINHVVGEASAYVENYTILKVACKVWGSDIKLSRLLLSENM